MSSSNARFSLWLIPLLFLSLCPVAVQAQGNMSKTHSVTGCLQKGIEPGGFFIAGEDGTMWELSGKVDATHVGHKVAVDGHVLHRSKTEEAKFADSEKQEAKGKPYADFQVTSLKMVSDTCQ
jgi:hypothetical protein